MSAYRDPDSFEFADYAGVLGRRWWLILVAVCVGLVAAGAYLVATPKAYTATSSVNVTATSSTAGQTGAVAGGRTNSAVNLDTEAQIVQSSQVATIAVRMLHSPLTPGALARHVSVTVPANSSVLQIACQAGSPNQAAACANAFATGYLQNRNSVAAAGTKAQLSTVRGQLDSLEKQIAQLTFRISVLPANSAQRASDQAQLQTASSQLHALATQSAALTAQGAAPAGGSVINRATPPGKPSSPKKSLVLASGLLAGLVLGLIAAFTWDRRDTRLKDAREADRFGVPVLLELDAHELGSGGLAPYRSAAGLKFAELARATVAALGNGNQVLVAGSTPGRSTSVISANLASSLARAHDAVILVCSAADGTPELLGLAEPGLGPRDAADLAAGALRLDRAAHRVPGLPGLRVVILGDDVPDLQSDQARYLDVLLRGSADYVVFESPQPSSGVARFGVIDFADAAMVAIEVSRSRRQDVEACLRRFGRLGIEVIGTAAMPRLPARTAPDRAGEPGARRAIPGTSRWQQALGSVKIQPAIRAGRPVPGEVDTPAETAPAQAEPAVNGAARPAAERAEPAAWDDETQPAAERAEPAARSKTRAARAKPAARAARAKPPVPGEVRPGQVPAKAGDRLRGT